MPMALTLESHIKHAPDTHFSRHENGGVLLSLASGTYFALNAVGVVIWELADGRMSLLSVLERLSVLWPEADPSDLQRDLTEFLAVLLEKGLLEVER